MHPAVDFHLSELTGSKAETEQGEDPQIWVAQARIISFFLQGDAFAPLLTCLLSLSLP